MRRITSILVSAVIILAAALAAAEMMHCTECGMIVDASSKFSSRVVQKDKSLPFCDIGDLLAYLKKNKPRDSRAEVKDYPSGAWLDAGTAFYVHAEKKLQSPMGWGIAAFKNKEEAAAYGKVMNFDGALEAVR
jgi:nitrous oxide reductase accessory protein NosL